MPSSDLTRIASNIGAMNALDSLRRVNSQLSTSQLRLSTGKRINSAADDPAGYFIATTLNARTEGMRVALDNIGDGKNVLSIAEGGLQKINDILLQMRSKTEQAGSTTLNTSQRQAIGTQLDQYVKEIKNIVAQTSFNNISLIGTTAGAASDPLTLLVGPGNSSTVDQLTFGVTNNANAASAFDATGLGIQIADTTTAAAASVSNLPTGFVMTTGSAAPLGRPGYDELASGNYYLETSGSVVGTYQFRLVDSAGNAVYIDDASDSGTLMTAGWQTAELVDAAAWDTGRGLSINITDASVPTTFGGGGELNTKDNGAAVIAYTQAVTVAGGYSKVDTSANALIYMGLIDSAMNNVAGALASVGAYQARLVFKEDFLMTSVASNEASYNRIMNADMAQEQVNATKYSILQQVATAMLTQANAAPQSVLALFR